MATDTTPKKLLKQEARKVLTVDDLEAHTELAYTLDAIDNQAQISAEDGIIGGFEVEHDSGNDFSVGTGFALDGGELVKLTSAATVTLNDNASGTWRKDLVVIDSTSDTNTDTSSDKRLSSTTVTQVTASTIGTGNGVDTLFDLGQSKVIPRTLLIENPSSTTVAGWVFVPEGGAGTNDAILFATAPASGNVDATFKYYTGAEEEVPGVPYATRKQREASIAVVQGTPGAPVSAGAGQIPLAEIEVPSGWTGGAPTDILNSVKTFLIAEDYANDTELYSPFDRPARITDAIRSIGQVRQGCRLYLHNSTTLRMAPGWINALGLSCRVTSPVSLTLQSTSSGSAGYVPLTDWYPVFAVPQSASNGSGLAPALRIGAGVNSLGHDTSSPSPLWQGGLHLGWVYVTVSGSTVTIRPFRSRGKQGDVVYWETPTDITLAGSVDSTASPDIDVTAWCPPTGCEILVEVDAVFVPADAADICIVEAGSLKYNSGSPNPWPRIKLAQGGTTGTTRLVGNGWLLVEDDSGTRYVHNLRTTSGTGSCTGNLRVMGYRDSSYATMDSSGGILSY